MRLVLAFAALAVSVLASASEQAPEIGPLDIPVEEWAEMSRGRTLSYAIGGEVWARESYDPASNRVRLLFSDGKCLVGTWDYIAPLYCFHWEAVGTSCFRHVRLGGAIAVLEMRDGAETGAVQIMSGVSDGPVSCGPSPMS